MTVNKSYKYNVRVMEKERKELKAWIKSNKDLGIKGKKINESSLIRSLVRWFLKKDFPISNQEIVDLRDLKNTLTNMGSNLNQLTKAYNTGLINVPVNTADYFEELKKEISQVRKVQAKLVAHIEMGLDSEISEILNE